MKIDRHTFMDSPDELHAFVIGFMEILCPWPPRIRLPDKQITETKGDCPKKALRAEYHYYLFGRGIGIIAWIAIAKIIQVIFW